MFGDGGAPHLQVGVRDRLEPTDYWPLTPGQNNCLNLAQKLLRLGRRLTSATSYSTNPVLYYTIFEHIENKILKKIYIIRRRIQSQLFFHEFTEIKYRLL